MVKRNLQITIFCIILILTIVSCTFIEQIPEQKENKIEKIEEIEEIKEEKNEDLTQEKKEKTSEIQYAEENPYQTCTHTKNKKETKYHFSEDGRILEINGKKFYYLEDKLIIIKEKKNQEKNIEIDTKITELAYQDGKLMKIGETILLRDTQNRISNIESPEKKISIIYDSKSLPREIIVYNTKTSFDYDKEDRLKFITKGQLSIEIHYNENNLPNDFDAGNQNKLIIGYRGKKIATLGGTLFGKGLAIDYLRDGLKAKIFNIEDDSEFFAETEEALKKTIDLYIYCKKIRTSGDFFDSKAYVFFRQYFSKEIEDFLIMEEYCKAV
jgi:RNase P/RNase MRP subunit p29